eukprot:4199510-Alexandrium_andersonii.AAC.1
MGAVSKVFNPGASCTPSAEAAALAAARHQDMQAMRDDPASATARASALHSAKTEDSCEDRT